MRQNPELTRDYLDRLDAVQPKNLPPELDLFDEQTATRGMRLNNAAYSLKDEHQRRLFVAIVLPPRRRTVRTHLGRRGQRRGG